MQLEVDYIELEPQMGDTVDALLKLYNRHDLKYIHMVQLRHLFYTLNNTDIIKIGTQIKIPILYTEGREEKNGSIDSMRKLRSGKKILKNYQDIETDDPEVKKLKDDRTVIKKIADITLESLGLKKKIEPPEKPKGNFITVNIDEIVSKDESVIIKKQKEELVAIEEKSVVKETIVDKSEMLKVEKPKIIQKKIVKTTKLDLPDKFIPKENETFEEAEARFIKEQKITVKTIKRFKRSYIYKTFVRHFSK